MFRADCFKTLTVRKKKRRNHRYTYCNALKKAENGIIGRIVTYESDKRQSSATTQVVELECVCDIYISGTAHPEH